jgi:hypothetical protein
MGRLIAVLLALLMIVSVADARTSRRKCRKSCKPLISAVCPSKGKARRVCRRQILRECRREGVATCAAGLPTGGPGDGTFTPGSTTTTTTTPSTGVTTTTEPGTSVTTTTLPAGVVAVAGGWRFGGTVVQPGCNIDYDIESTLAVSQDGAALTGTIEGVPGSGTASASGWSFGTAPDCRQVPDSTEVCCLHFTVEADGATSSASAQAVAGATCDDGSTCEARWTGTVTRIP